MPSFVKIPEYSFEIAPEVPVDEKFFSLSMVPKLVREPPCPFSALAPLMANSPLLVIVPMLIIGAKSFMFAKLRSVAFSPIVSESFLSIETLV